MFVCLCLVRFGFRFIVCLFFGMVVLYLLCSGCCLRFCVMMFLFVLLNSVAGVFIFLIFWYLLLFDGCKLVIPVCSCGIYCLWCFGGFLVLSCRCLFWFRVSGLFC